MEYKDIDEGMKEMFTEEEWKDLGYIEGALDADVRWYDDIETMFRDLNIDTEMVDGDDNE